jgi:hypothetical protein
MLPALVIPRQPSVNPMKNNDLHCMHHEPVTVETESGEAGATMWTTAARDAASGG